MKKKKDSRIKILEAYVRRDNLRIETIARGVGVSVPTIYNWIDGRSGVSPLASPLLDKFLSDYAATATTRQSSEVATLTGMNG